MRHRREANVQFHVEIPPLLDEAVNQGIEILQQHYGRKFTRREVGIMALRTWLKGLDLIVPNAGLQDSLALRDLQQRMDTVLSTHESIMTQHRAIVDDHVDIIASHRTRRQKTGYAASQAAGLGEMCVFNDCLYRHSTVSD